MIYYISFILSILWIFIGFISSNLHEFLDYSAIFLMYAIVAAIGVVIYGVASLLLPSRFRPRVAAVLTVGFPVLFMLPVVREMLKWAGLYSHPTLFISWLVFFVAGTAIAAVLINSRRRLTFLTCVFAAMTAVAAFPALSSFTGNSGLIVPDTSGTGRTGPAPASRPNVYYIVIDSYARNDTLLEIVGHDNSNFTKALADFGFVTLRKATSNYLATINSLISTLSMDYMFTEDNSSDQDWNAVFAIKKGENAVVRKFLGLDYNHAAIGGQEFCGSKAFYCIQPEGFWTKGTWALIHNTPLPGVLITLSGPLYGRIFNTGTRANFTTTAITKKIPEIWTQAAGKPVFTLYHSLELHDMIYGEDCRIRPELGKEDIDRVDTEERIIVDTRLYRQTVRCLNGQLLNLVDRIVDEDKDAIIVLTSDHGTAFTRYINAGSAAPASTNETYLKERTAIFSSWRLPDRCRRNLRQDMSAVNHFRTIFACIEGVEPKMLENRYYAPVPKSPRLAREITGQIVGN